MRFEDDLRRALRPLPPPEGFADRVLERIAVPEMPAGATAEAVPARRAWGGLLAAVAAVFVMATAGGVYYEHRLAQIEGARAARDVQTALHIVSEKLAVVERRVNRVGEPGF